MTQPHKPWYASWFDSPWYHLLYKHRDESEAQRFIDQLIAFIQPSPQARFLDLACGRGRHSRYLHRHGHHTTGLDLSAESIAFAKQFEEPGLEFAVHDMRDVYQPKAFDVTFNLFTSFGYFEDTKDNLRVLRALHQQIKSGGCMVLDFLNADKTIRNLVPQETIEREGIRFDVRKRHDNGSINKTISFEAEGEQYQFEEHVCAFSLQDFRSMFEQTGFSILHIFGDYHLGPFDPDNSDRLILIAQPS